MQYGQRDQGFSAFALHRVRSLLMLSIVRIRSEISPGTSSAHPHICFALAEQFCHFSIEKERSRRKNVAGGAMILKQ
jgi:hypothetical protein